MASMYDSYSNIEYAWLYYTAHGRSRERAMRWVCSERTIPTHVRRARDAMVAGQEDDENLCAYVAEHRQRKAIEKALLFHVRQR